MEAIPEFAPLLDQHREDFDEVLAHTLFDDFTRFVLDAHHRDDDELVARCLAFLASAIRSEDPEIEQLVAATFIEEVGPWNPDMADFIATWPDALRAEATRQVQAATA